MNEKRKRIFVSLYPSVFQYFFKPGIFEIQDNRVPKDSKYIGVQYDWERDRFLICFEHKSFEPIPEGMCLPIHESLKIIVRKK